MLHVILNQKLQKASFQQMYNIIMVVAFEVWMLNFPEVLLTHLPIATGPFALKKVDYNLFDTDCNCFDFSNLFEKNLVYLSTLAFEETVM